MSLKETSLWTALITPFSSENKAVDFECLHFLLKRQEAAGNGILMLGSTGEALALTKEEKQKIVRFTCEQNLAVPIMVGVPNINLDETQNWLKFCNGLGVDAYLASTPSYTKPGLMGQTEWFRRILDAADAPVMLYNVPSRTGMPLLPGVLSALSCHGNFWALKESSGLLDPYIDYTSAAPSVRIYCGDDHLLPSAAPLGAVGLVSVASNMWPDISRAYVEACSEGRYQGHAWWHISKSLFTATSPVPIKAVMHAKGLLDSPDVRLPLCKEDLHNLDLLMDADRMATTWMNYQAPRRDISLPPPVFREYRNA